MNLDDFMNQAFWDRVAREACSHVSGMNGVMLAIFWSIFAFAAVFTYFQMPRPRSIRGLFGHVLPQATLRHPSARADFLFWLSRRIFMPLLVLPTVFSTVAAGHVAYSLLASVLGPPAHAAGAAGPL